MQGTRDLGNELYGCGSKAMPLRLALPVPLAPRIHLLHNGGAMLHSAQNLQTLWQPARLCTVELHWFCFLTGPKAGFGTAYTMIQEQGQDSTGKTLAQRQHSSLVPSTENTHLDQQPNCVVKPCREMQL